MIRPWTPEGLTLKTPYAPTHPPGASTGPRDRAPGGMVVRAPIRRILLDILKPIKGPSVVDVAKAIASLPGVEGVNITVKEIDVDTITLSLTVEGSDIDFDMLRNKLEELGCAIHSIDQVVAGKRIVEEPRVEE